ncbi:MAG TPA: nickel ABC transporter permease subunit NikC [Clostridium sp.]|nr:nickel ABC transporter permease subunit NikC [Clostridium sp.]
MHFNNKFKASREHKKMIIVLSLIIFIILVSLLSKYIAPNDPYLTDLTNILQVPSRKFPLGTDSLGRCVLSRVLYGGSKSILSALIVVGISFLFGSILGMIGGFFGGKADSVIVSIIDIFLAFPGMILAIAIAGILGAGMKNAIIAIILVSWTKYARLSRSETIKIRSETYIKAAIISGNSRFRIILKHIFPNIISTLIIIASSDIGVMIMEIAGLSFLGLSSPLPIPEWGSMMNEGKGVLQSAPWVALSPGIAVFITVVLFNLLGDIVTEILGNKQRRKK